MKKIPNWIIIIIVLAIIVASKFLFFQNKTINTSNINDKNKKPIAVNYYVTKLTSFSNDVFATGKIGAINEIEIFPEVNGKVTNIYFKEGETINKGTIMVKLNDADLQAQLLKNKTQIALSVQKLDRLNKLLGINGISQEEFDIQQNELNSYKADQAYITAQIAKTTITAPFTGIVGLKNISEGSFISSSTPVASLVQVKPLYVEFSIPEKYSYQLKKGLKINFANDNSGKELYSATIYAIEPKIDEATKTIKARALYNGSQLFFTNSFVKVYIDLGKIENTIMVPTECIIPTLKSQKVIVTKNGIANEVVVNIGIRTDDKIQIIKGLNAGDTVITTGLLSVKNQSLLKLLKSDN